MNDFRWYHNLSGYGAGRCTVYNSIRLASITISFEVLAFY